MSTDWSQLLKHSQINTVSRFKCDTHIECMDLYHKQRQFIVTKKNIFKETEWNVWQKKKKNIQLFSLWFFFFLFFFGSTPKEKIDLIHFCHPTLEIHFTHAFRWPDPIWTLFFSLVHTNFWNSWAVNTFDCLSSKLFVNDLE